MVGFNRTRVPRMRPTRSKLIRFALCLLVGCSAPPMATAADPTEDDFYPIVTIAASQSQSKSRSKYWLPPKGLTLEVSGIDVLPDGRVAVAIRKGEIWFLDNVYENPPRRVRYHRFASGLHEPLGLMYDKKSFYVLQRAELTRIADTDGDDVADLYTTVAKGWQVTGNYHEYAYGPKKDKNGDLWLTLNVGISLSPLQRRKVLDTSSGNAGISRWRGWGMRVDSQGRLTAECAGMRSPCGIGSNLAGDMFFTDQQGNWIGTCTLHHLQRGAFYGHVDSLPSTNLRSSPIRKISAVPANLPFPVAAKRLKELKLPAIWFPYKKMGQASTDIACDRTSGRFGPFAGQLFVGDFTTSSIGRVFLERVRGEYQGACFPFRRGFASAVLRMEFGKDGSMFVGLTNRGWSSVGNASFGLQRLIWTKKVPFEFKEMKARPDGFELVYTKPVGKSAGITSAYSMASYTYRYQKKYGSDEIEKKTLKIKSAVILPDRRRVRIVVEGLRPGYVHELRGDAVRSSSGDKLLHPDAYYTLNRIPRR